LSAQHYYLERMSARLSFAELCVASLKLANPLQAVRRELSLSEVM
jgi:hypothetical protein